MPAPGAQYESDNIKNPFDERRVSHFTAQEIATLQCRLNKQLGPEYISHRSGAGGSKVAYLEGTKAIALANDVFGFNGWSSSLQQVQVDYVDEHTNGRINLGLSIIVRVTLKDGTYHEDIGYGMIENAKGKGAAFEKAKKEAATDGLKRALRNFGNVLGNCLYDKEYLKKVNTMKVKPVAFNEDRLHRHPDFRPPALKDEHEMVKKEQRTPIKADLVGRSNMEQKQESVVAVTAEFEDEFGGNLFDGMDISEHQGDEFTFETVAVAEEPTSRSAHGPQGPGRPAPGSNAVANRQAMVRMQSMPAIRDQHVSLRPQQSHQQGQGLSRGAAQSNPTAPQTPVAHQSNGRVEMNRRAPATVDIHAPPVQHQQQNQPQRATPPQGPGTHVAPAKPNSSNGPIPPSATRVSVGFVTSRAAELVQNSDASMSLSNLPAFNPSVESPIPMDKRTPGFDHTRSMKVTRESVGAPAPPPPPPALQQQPPQPQQGGNQFRPVGPVNRTNFVNPQHDTNRKIGMPGTHSMSPMANRGAYKPPGPVGGIKRPPLADVSNQNAAANGDGPSEAKKPKLDANSVGIENPNTNVAGT